MVAEPTDDRANQQRLGGNDHRIRIHVTRLVRRLFAVDDVHGWPVVSLLGHRPRGHPARTAHQPDQQRRHQEQPMLRCKVEHGQEVLELLSIDAVRRRLKVLPHQEEPH
jgi:ribulose bisphosphate carboxylase small subunit